MITETSAIAFDPDDAFCPTEKKPARLLCLLDIQPESKTGIATHIKPVSFYPFTLTSTSDKDTLERAKQNESGHLL